MLGYKDGVAAHGGLFAIIVRLGRGEAGSNEFVGVLANGGYALGLDNRALSWAQVEAGPEAGGSETVESAGDRRGHYSLHFTNSAWESRMT
jgi:hypothetical protein